MADYITQTKPEPVEPQPTLPPGYIAQERNRYFTGKFLTARDLRDEQGYHLSRHWLHNRLLHGFGVVCGLSVKHHPRLDCRDRFVVVHAGVAIDCFGRELILRADEAVPIPLPNAHSSAADRRIVVALRYSEQHDEASPVLCYEGDPEEFDPDQTEANRIREAVTLHAFELAEFPGHLHEWPIKPTETTAPIHSDLTPCAAPKATAPCYDDSTWDLPSPSGASLEPLGRSAGWLPIALLSPQPGNQEDPWLIDTRGRRQMVPPPPELTHIVGHNWPHGGRLSLADLRASHNKLRVYFDRPLRMAADGTNDINGFTFSVTYEGRPQRTLEFLPEEPRHGPRLTDDGYAAEFTIASWYIDPAMQGPTLPVGTNIYITLRCNFLADQRGMPVDGDYLCGVLPSGDGVPGGTFESWFQIRADEARADEAKQEQEKPHD